MSSENSKNFEKPSSDPRFSRVYNDPKFKKTKSRDHKIKLDDRFSKKDLEIKKKSKVDKYGRKINDKTNNKDLADFDKYFEKETSEETNEEIIEETKNEESQIPIVDRARGEVLSDYVSSSDEYTSSDSETSGESELESESESDVEIETSKPEVGDPSKTLAVVNLDWDHVKSEDLLVTFSSFIPKGGRIDKIAIYPSEFGKERMKREEVEGPSRELFKKKSKKSKNKKEASDDTEIGLTDLYEEGDADKDVDRRALRQYQLERLRYYYAIVYCNNIETSSSIYQNCDGTEYESTANMFDLRYVPDEMNFEDKPKDECSQVPKNYKPLQFSTDALQHSNVKLTWDETPADRVEISKRAFSQKEIEDMDFKAYLASDSDHSDEEVNQDAKNKLLSLVGKSFGETAKDRGNDGEDEVDMEITFTPGLQEGSVAEEENAEENTIEKVRRREKERRKARKDKLKELKKASNDERKEKLKSSKHGKKEDQEMDSKSRAELELLMMDDGNDAAQNINKDAHFNMKEILRSEKEKSKRSKYQDKNKIVEDKFEADLNDPRFKEMFENHDFAIDPSQPEFKETATMKKMVNQRNKFSKNSRNSNKKRKATSDVHDSKSNIENIVKKLKNKGRNN